MQTYLTFVTHPLLWVFLGLLIGFYLILWTASLKVPKGRTPGPWLRRNYWKVILMAVGALAVLALTFYLVEIGVSVAALVNRLGAAAANPETPSVDLRNIAYAVAVLVGVLAAATTVFFSSIRVWINERTATATEEGLITDRINTAVEGLGAEKTEKTYGTPEGATTIQQFERTVPNLEVRIGAIYALERIAQDSDRDHVQIMEILCAYIRQNAPASLAVPFPEDWAAAFDAVEKDPTARPPHLSEVQIWKQGLAPPREDIQVALRVLGRRSSRQISLEGHWDHNGNWQGYRIDLRNTCLQRADMVGGRFEHAEFSGARFEGADLVGVWLKKAGLGSACLQAADLTGARLQRAMLIGASFQAAELYGAQLQGAHRLGARFQGADLRKVQY